MNFHKRFSTFRTCKTIRYMMLKRAGECICSNFEEPNTGKILLDIVGIIRGTEQFNELVNPIDPNNLNERQMKELGFRQGWDNSEIMLLPIWLFPFMVDEFVCCSTFDNVQITHKRSEMSIRNFGGWMEYGIIPKDKKK